MYRLIEENVSEARRKFTANVKEIAAGGECELIVLVLKRGEPQAVIVSPMAFGQFIRWQAEQQRQYPQPPTGRPEREVNLLDSGPLREAARKGKENRRQADEPRTKEAGDTPAQDGGTAR